MKENDRNEYEDVDGIRLVLKSDHGAVWHVEESGHFWIQFGNIRWQMDIEALAAYRNYIRTVATAVSTKSASVEEASSEPIFLRTKDPVICLAFDKFQILEFTYLLDTSETLFRIEQSPA